MEKTGKTVKVRVTKRYNDIVLKKILKVNDVLTVPEARAKHLVNHGFVEVINEEVEKAAKAPKTEGKE